MNRSYFGNIEPIAYEGLQSTNPLAFRYYNKTRVVLGKTMEAAVTHGRVLLAYLWLGWI